MRSIVAFYEVDREYGGPEEGGWYFSSGRFVRAIGFYLTDRRSVESVLYYGGRFRAFSFTGLPPERFPVNRPHYE
jgi:hypothetical protein